MILVPILAFIALTAWAFASPVGSSPDEDFHLTSIWCAAGSQPGVCETTANPAERIVPQALVNVACYAHLPATSGACQNSDVNWDSTDTVITNRGSFRDNYPPIFYATMHAFVGPNIEISVLVMRMVNILYFVGVATLLWFLLPRFLRPTLVWGWVITMVPLGLFLIASVNPSSWAITGIGASWIALYGFFRTAGRQKIGLAAIYAVTTFLAAGARGDAAIYSILTAVVVSFLAFRKDRRFLLELILPLALVVVAALFYLSSQQSGVIQTGLPEDNAGGTIHVVKPGAGSILVNNLLNVPSLIIGVFGSWSLGWLDTALPVIVWSFSAAAFVGVAFTGLVSIDWRKIVALVGLAGILWLLPVYILQRSLSIVGTQVQPRYILPLIVLFAGVALLTVGRRGWRLTTAQRWLVVGGLAVAQAVSLHYNMKRYIKGVGTGGGVNLNSGILWWWHIPISPMVFWAIGALAFAGMLVVIARELRPFEGEVAQPPVEPQLRGRRLPAAALIP